MELYTKYRQTTPRTSPDKSEIHRHSINQASAGYSVPVYLLPINPYTESLFETD